MSDIGRPCSPVLFALVVSAILLPVARAQFVQQGSRLVGTGAVGDALQGSSVALSADGSTAAVGGFGDNDLAGAVWVYTRSGGVWSQQGDKLVGKGAAGGAVVNRSVIAGAMQGVAVAASGDGNTILAGGFLDNNTAGAAWVFTRSGGVWTQQGDKLVGMGAVGTSYQGQSVALSEDGNTAMVGGFADDNYLGAAWVFTRSNGVWTQQGDKLVGTGAVGKAGQGSVALSGDDNTAILGGDGDNGNAGAAWVFTRTAGVWTQQGAKLVGTGAVGAAWQGASVALSGDGNTAIVGGVADNSFAGASWVFTRSGGVWTQQGSKLVGTGAAVPVQASQGAVALSGDGNTAILGAEGVGGAWAFTRVGGVWTQLGGELAGTGGTQGDLQGRSVAMSKDGSTAIVGGQANGQDGAAWVFVKVPASTAQPTVTSIVNGAGFAGGGGISPGSWVTIFGTGLAPAGVSRTWDASTEIVDGKLPLSLDGTSVTVNGKQAAVEFIQPSQVNIQTPDDAAIGPVQVVANTAAGATTSYTVNYATFAPGLFPASAPYIVAQHADNSYVTTAAPAKPGEAIILWGTGFGPADPAVPAGQVFSGANPLANTVTVTIGGQFAPVDFAGVVGAGLVQINVHVPASINNGDAPVVATVGGVATQTTANMISVHN